MNPNFSRGLLLFQQSRFELAEGEFRQSLALAPDDAHAHALLGLCLSEREQFPEAAAEVGQAIHLRPDFSFAHYADARVFFARNRFSEALTAIHEAIRLDPEDADYYSVLANIHVEEHRWRDALNAAEQGLQFDPEHIGCVNLRAIALVKLGNRAAAGQTIDAALAKHPESAVTHANQGWTFLEKGEPAKALAHFREALRLDPMNEWARRGTIEALKARNVIYALMLKYFLWMSRLSRRAQWYIIIGGFIGNRMLGVIAASNPALAPWVLPLRILYVCFAMMTWLASPFFNLLLRLNPFGKLVLSRDQVVAGNWLGLCLLCALAAFAGTLWNGFDSLWAVAAMVFGFLLIPVSMVYRCPSGSQRRTMAGITIGLALCGLAAIGLMASPESGRAGDSLGLDLFTVCAIGSVGSTWLGNILFTRRRRR